MFRCSYRKAIWYVKRNLAVILEDTPHLTVQLTFVPQGLGGHSFYCHIKENLCAVCGADEDLSRHHIVPYCFRRHLPDDYKSHVAFDVLPLCEACHNKYEKFAAAKKLELATFYKINNYEAAIKLANCILGYKRILESHIELPAGRREEIVELLKKNMGQLQAHEIVANGLVNGDILFICDEFSKRKKNNKGRSRRDSSRLYSFGRLLMSLVEDKDEFVKDWRRHFVETMRPKFLPTGWEIDHPTRLSTSLDYLYSRSVREELYQFANNL